MTQKFPEKKENPRKSIIPVVVTKQEKEAIQKEAAARNSSASTVAYEMMKRGSLETLVAHYFPSTSD